MTVLGTQRIRLGNSIKETARSSTETSSRLSMLTSLAFKYTTERASFNKCDLLFCPGEAEKEIKTSSRGLAPERMDSLIFRQNPRIEHGLLELVVNAIEATIGQKIVGRFGEGRLQCLRQIAGDENASITIHTKSQNDVCRQIVFRGIRDNQVDVLVELSEAENTPQTGTEIRLNRPLRADEKSRLEDYLHEKLRYLKILDISINGKVINERQNIVGLGKSAAAPSDRIDIMIDDFGFCVRDHGIGMNAETIVKRYLTIGNSLGEHERVYDDSIQEADIYYSLDPSSKQNKTAKGRVSFLLCGVEVEGIEIEGVNIEEHMAIELGTGLKLSEAKDKVHMGKEDVNRIKDIIQKILEIKGERKWALINSLMQALIKVEFANGEKEQLINWIYQKVRDEASIDQQAVYVPNKQEFVGLQTAKRKIYLDENLFDFNPKAAGLEARPSYEGRGGHQLYLADFDNNDVYVQIGKIIIINRKYAGNTFMLNLLFNFYIGYGQRTEGKIKIKNHWESAPAAEKDGGMVGETMKKRTAVLPAKEPEDDEVTKIKGLSPEERAIARNYIQQRGQVGLEDLRLAVARRDEFEARFGEHIGLEEILYEYKTDSRYIAIKDVAIHEGKIYMIVRDRNNKCSLAVVEDGKIKEISSKCEDAKLIKLNGGILLYIKKFEDEDDDDTICAYLVKGDTLIGRKEGDLKDRFEMHQGKLFSSWNASDGSFGGIFEGDSSCDPNVIVDSGQKIRISSGNIIQEDDNGRMFVAYDLNYGDEGYDEDKPKTVIGEILGGEVFEIMLVNNLTAWAVCGGKIYVVNCIGEEEKLKNYEVGMIDIDTKEYSVLGTLLYGRGEIKTAVENGNVVIFDGSGRIGLVYQNELYKGEFYLHEGKVYEVIAIDYCSDFTDCRLLSCARTADTRNIFYFKYGFKPKMFTSGGRLFAYEPEQGMSLEKFSESYLHYSHLKDPEACFHFCEIIDGEVFEIPLPNKKIKLENCYNFGGRIFFQDKGTSYSYELIGDKLKLVAEPAVPSELNYSEGRIFIRGESEDKAGYMHEILPGGKNIFLIVCGPRDLAFLTHAGIKSIKLPTEMPDRRNWFSDKKSKCLYEEKMESMHARVIRGDFIEGIDLEIFGYLDSHAVKALGEETVKLIEKRIEGRSFEYVDIYLRFIEKLWKAGGEDADPDLLRRVVDRWDNLFDLYGDDIKELENLSHLFDRCGLPLHLVDGREIEMTPEIQDWVEYFRAENLEGIVKEKKQQEEPNKTAKTLHAVGLEHDLAFYSWAQRIHRGWAKRGIKKHKALIDEYNRTDTEPANKRIKGIVLGQELKEFSYSRELAQNSRDACATTLTIETYLETKNNQLFHSAEFVDDGEGMDERQVKEWLLNIEGNNKAGELRKDGMRKTGGNGIGFKSVFSDADQVSVRTSRGDGKITEVDIECQRKEGKIIGINVKRFGVAEGVFKGTAIKASKAIGAANDSNTKIRAVLRELMYKRKLKKYVGLVSDMQITHNGESIKEEMNIEDQIRIEGKGTFRLLSIKAAEHRVIQDGLYVNDRLEKYVQYVPELLRNYIDGCVFEVGEEIQLTRGRGETMSSDKEVGAILTVLAMRRAVKEHISGKRILTALPQDYLYGQDKEIGTGDIEGRIPFFVYQDADAINEGQIEDVDFDKYSGAGQNEFVKLLTIIEVEDEKGQRISLKARRELARQLARGKGRNYNLDHELTSAIEMRKLYIDAGKQERKSVENLTEDQIIFRDYARKVLEIMELDYIITEFFSHPNEPVDARGGGGLIGFRVEAWDFNKGRRMLEEDGMSEQKSIWLTNFLETLIHEASHNLEGGGDWTHGANPELDRSFAWRMRELIITLIKNGYTGKESFLPAQVSH